MLLEIHMCPYVSMHNLCYSLLLPGWRGDAEKKKNLAKVSQGTLIGWGWGETLTPTWLPEVLVSLPMAIQGASVPQEFTRSH